jgi:hypothetical protein
MQKKPNKREIILTSHLLRAENHQRIILTMPNQGFTLQVAVKTLEKEPFAGLNHESGFQIGSVHVSITQRSGYLVLKARDFVTEEEAASFLPRLKAGLWNLALEYNIAFIPGFEQRKITRSKDPKTAGRNIAASFGLSDLGPVHGLADEGGTVIFPSNENIRFLGVEGTARISCHFNNAFRVLSEGIKSTQLGASFVDETLSIAFDLYLGHFYEGSIRARFLTLIMTLEVLAPVTEKHFIVQKLLTKWREEIQDSLAQTADEDAQDALEALDRELNFRKETSIRRRVRRLILDEAPLDEPDRTALSKQVIRAYDLRGSLAHSGAVDENKLYEAHDITLRAVKLILRTRLGLVCTDRC